MTDCETLMQIELFTKNFKDCKKMLTAIGDETRQHMILEMIKVGDCNGLRIGTITKCTNLSRQAVSCHLKILMNAGLVKRRKEGTKNYYFFDPDQEILQKTIYALQLAQKITNVLPNRNGEN